MKSSALFLGFLGLVAISLGLAFLSMNVEVPQNTVLGGAMELFNITIFNIFNKMLFFMAAIVVTILLGMILIFVLSKIWNNKYKAELEQNKKAVPQKA